MKSFFAYAHRNLCRKIVVGGALGFLASLSLQAADPPPSTPNGVRVVTGGTSIVVDWTPSTGINPIKQYNVYRNNVLIGSSAPNSAPLMTADLYGARFIDKSITAGATYSYQVEAVDILSAISAKSTAVSAKAPSATTAPITITSDTTLAPDLANHINNVVIPELKIWYPKMGDKISYPNYTPTNTAKIVFDPNTGALAANPSTGTIYVNPTWLRTTNLANLGGFIHEAGHVLQKYSARAPGWIVEGIADWTGRVFYDEKPTPRLPKVGNYFKDGYEDAALFFNWMETKYDSQLVRKLNLAAHDGKYNENFFVTATGKSLKQLWGEYVGMPVNDGIIMFKTYYTYCMDVDTANGYNITAVNCADKSSQLWKSYANTDGTYFLSSSLGCMAPATNTSGSTLRAFSCTGSSSLKWQILANGSLKHVNSGLCVDITGVSANTPNLHVYSCTGGATQTVIPPTMYKSGAIASAFTGKCLDNFGGLNTDGRQVAISSCQDNIPQTWQVVPLSNGNYNLRVMGKCLDVRSSGTANGSVVQIYACNGTAAQSWQLLADGSLKNTNSGKCLDIPGSNTTDGTKLQIYTCNGTNAQRWTLPRS